MTLALVLLTALLPAPSSTGPTGAGTLRPIDREVLPSPTARRFVFAFLPAVTFGLSALPSVDLPFYFGRRMGNGRWALGYQFTLSSGLAERYTAGILTHRHHLTALTTFGPSRRRFASIGGGAALLTYFSPVVEVEGRFGWHRFGKRNRGVVGLVFRLGWNLGRRELAPAPQLGLMFGLQSFEAWARRR